MQLTLNADEADALRSALRSYISDLRMEVVDTERMGMREELKRQEALLRSLAERLDRDAVAAGTWPYEPAPDVDSEL